MWTIDPKEVCLLRGSGGQPFTEFVNSALSVEAFLLGIPASQIAMTLRVNVGDGGVDSRIDHGAASDRTGWLGVPSAWQYKAEEGKRVSAVSICKEMEKHHARELIQRGYGYRVCVCDELTPEKKDKLARALNLHAKKINPDAPLCFVISASDLASWASRFASVGVRFFNRPLAIGQDWRAWESAQTNLTQKFVTPDRWKGPMLTIQSHIDFLQKPISPLLPVQGVAGVGKTRLVCEAIRQVPGAYGLIVTTDGEDDAKKVARWVKIHPQVPAILVADECSASGREELRKLAQGAEDRLRVIAIDNDGEAPASGSPEIWLERMDDTSARTVLDRNFPLVPSERRWAYAELSEGYIRLAADLCWYDAAIAASGRLDAAIPTLRDFYRNRLSDEDQRVVEAVALVHRVGYTDDLSGQLDQLAVLTNIDRHRIVETAKRLKDAPGFIAVGRRYLYVTPQIIAEIAFRRAWGQWAEPNPAAFLDGFPADLRNAFELRVRGVTDQGVRSFVSAHFRDRVAGLAPDDLADFGRMRLLVDLVETDPMQYLPFLKRIIEDATNDQLLATGVPEYGQNRSRREIVWAAERLAAFPEFFPSAELILRRLAIAETEHGIGNNATGIWRQLFRVYLSGTSVPFIEKIPIFRSMLFSNEPWERELAVGALKDLLSSHVSRMGSPSLVGGRVPPTDWRPTSHEEWAACVRAVFDTIRSMLAAGPPLAEEAWRYLTQHLRSLLIRRQLEALRGLVEEFPVPETVRGAWFAALDDFFHYDCRPAAVESELSRYCQSVRDWRDEYFPRDFSGRLRVSMSKNYWHHSMREGVWKSGSEIGPLADEIIAQEGLLEANMEFLFSPEARSAWALGAELARRDSDARLLDRLLLGAREFHNTGLLRGYIANIVSASASVLTRIASILDRLEGEAPLLAVDLTAAAPDHTDSATRLIRMVSNHKADPSVLEYLHYGSTLSRMPPRQLVEAFELLMSAPKPMTELASDLLGTRLQKDSADTLSDPDFLRGAVSVLEAAAGADDQGDYWWGEALQHVADCAPNPAAQIALTTILGESWHKKERATAVLARIASRAPDIAIDAFGPSILDKNLGWRWQVGEFREIFESLPVEAVSRWLDQVGVVGARRIARHLPRLAVVEGQPIVPALTEMVLGRFGDDSKVLNEFTAGVHHLQMTWGNLSSVYEGHRKIAEQFLNHPVAAIREWAAQEVSSSRRMETQAAKEEEDRGW